MAQGKLADLAGRTFGRLYVVERASNTRGHAYWMCRCICGTSKRIRGSLLRSGETTSCGCLARELAGNRIRTHGQTNSRTWLSWKAMLQRCNDAQHHAYPRYAGRGITVCERWHVYENFLADMGPRPPGTSIDRRDNDKGYCSENCWWATRRQQQRNTSTNHRMTYGGETLTLVEWSERIGIHPMTIRQRLVMGWSVERALSTPLRKIRKRSA